MIFKKSYPKEPFSEDDTYVFMMAKPRHITMETDEFTSQEIENWPKIHLVILNSEDQQIIAVERRTNAFVSTKNAINKLNERLNFVLETHNLSVHINPIYDKHHFWDYIKGKAIKKIEFHLVTPNMANISQAISEDLKNLAKTSNTAKTDLVLNAAENGSLHITPENTQITDLVDYSSQGGGSIKVQLNGYRRAIDLKKGIKTTTIDSMTISGHPSSIKDTILQVVTNDD